MYRRLALLCLTLAGLHLAGAGDALGAATAEFRIARFSTDVTIPLGHRCMGILPVKARRIVDPLEARGFVLLGPDAPIVLVAVDWCEIRNDAYDHWREVLARAAQTTPERVLLSSVHQHDAPVVDLGAARLLAEVGLDGELMDIAFYERTVKKVAAALRASLSAARPVTHIGIGQARVARVASNRRVKLRDSRIVFDRGSNSGGNPVMSKAPDGLIDPWLKTISFWDGATPLVALHAYATHPMSYYGRGGVSADFVGMARRRRTQDDPDIFQIYVTGCAGDITAGKYNDGAPPNRPVLAGRIHDAMKAAWRDTRRQPLKRVVFRSAPLELEFHEGAKYTEKALRQTLVDPQASTRNRILAAMGLSSRARIRRGHPIDVARIDLGGADIVLLPGESFVGYQLMAQRIRPDRFVMTIAYGECWPGYIPTRAAMADGFDAVWRWVAPGSEPRMRATLCRVLRDPPPAAGTAVPASEDVARDVYQASAKYPRYSEGSIIALRDGSLLYATTEFVGDWADHAAARIVARASQDGGRTWGAQRVLQENVGKQNVMSVTLRRFRSSGLSGLGMFYLVKNGPTDLEIQLRASSDEAASFAPPIRVTRDAGYHVMNNDRVTQLLDGRLLCPVSWSPDIGRRNHFVAYCYFSDDGGNTWQQGTGRVDLPRRGAMEPEVLERNDGRLLMIVRTQLGYIYAARSADRGATWSPAKSWNIAAPESPATLRRVPATGDLLLVWNPKVVAGADHGGKRTPLVAAISTDEGQTWCHRRALENRLDRGYSYPSVTFVGDRVVMSYYVSGATSKRISSRFRSLPLCWFYQDAE